VVVKIVGLLIRWLRVRAPPAPALHHPRSPTTPRTAANNGRNRRCNIDICNQATVIKHLCASARRALNAVVTAAVHKALRSVEGRTRSNNGWPVGVLGRYRAGGNAVPSHWDLEVLPSCHMGRHISRGHHPVTVRKPQGVQNDMGFVRHRSPVCSGHQSIERQSPSSAPRLRVDPLSRK
jgi:hypothetical protein